MTAAEHAAHAENYQRAALAQASSVAPVEHSRAGARAHEVPYGRRERERRAQESADQDEAVRRQFEGLLGRGRERQDSGSRPGARDDRFDIAQAMSFMPGGHREATASARAPYAPPGRPGPGHGTGGQGRSGGHGQGSHERPAYGVGAPRYGGPAAPAKRHH
ncbi:hypothetical protein GCM10027091_02960 [Streptomyces daliensis]